MQGKDEDSVLSSSRREALVAWLIWLVATSYTVGYCTWRGYGRDWETVSFVFGCPDWIFWGVVCPWLTCVAVSWWFAYCFMTDEPLGEDEFAETAPNQHGGTPDV